MVTLHYSFTAKDPQALVEWDVFELFISTSTILRPRYNQLSNYTLNICGCKWGVNVLCLVTVTWLSLLAKLGHLCLLLLISAITKLCGALFMSLAHRLKDHSFLIPCTSYLHYLRSNTL